MSVKYYKTHLVVRDAGEGEGDVADLVGPDLLVLLGVDDEDLVVLVPPLGRHRCLHREPLPLPVTRLGSTSSPLTPTWRNVVKNRKMIRNMDGMTMRINGTIVEE